MRDEGGSNRFALRTRRAVWSASTETRAMSDYDRHRDGPPNLLGWLLAFVLLGLIVVVLLGYFL